MTLETLFAPAEFNALPGRDLSRTTCVVFDILRATSSIVTALANGAGAVIPVAEIPEALALRRRDPAILLAGERDGVRIRANLAGGTEFDLGNSPREFTAVRGRTIALSTTNGSRALRACAPAKMVLAGSFLNLRATVRRIEQSGAEDLLLVCAGTYEQAAYEDALCAGAVADAVWERFSGGRIADSAVMVREIYLAQKNNLMAAMNNSRNARRLLENPDLREDVAWSLKVDVFDVVAELWKDGTIRAV